MERTYYAILEVHEHAGHREIQDAYRRLAWAYHPDTSGSDTTHRFCEIREAWETLGNPERRRAYDQRLHSQRRPLRTRRGSKTTWQTRDIFPDEELHLELRLSAIEARQGVAIRIDVPTRERCPSCGGAGRIYHGLCPTCLSYGWVIRMESYTLHIAAGQVSGNIVQLDLQEFDLIYRRLVIHVRVLH